VTREQLSEHHLKGVPSTHTDLHIFVRTVQINKAPSTSYGNTEIRVFAV